MVHSLITMKLGKKKDIKFRQKDDQSTKSVAEKASSMEGNKRNLLNQCLINSDEKWYNQVQSSNNINKELTLSSELVHSMRSKAQTFLDEDIKQYNKSQKKKTDKDFVWIKRILHSGTVSDKVSAYTLLIQDSPVHNLHSVEILVNMVNTKAKRECLMAIDALKDLFISELLAEERKLKLFCEQPLDVIDNLSNDDEQKRSCLLILWLFEDSVKSLYSKFLINLDAVSRDSVEKTKQKAITAMYNLLKENPEQEQFLLEHLVNKIGDPNPKVGSHVCHLLGQLLNHHTNMSSIVMQEVERLLFRPNVLERTKYYCLCFLNQIILNHDEYELANRLIAIYFGQFRACIKKGEVNTKMMSALLTGVSRAYPYAQLKDNILMEQLDAMYRLVHLVNFNISIQALMLIFQVLDSSDSISDRFYSTLYRKLSDPALGSSSRQSALLNLIYRAIKLDVSAVRIKAFVKRLLQVALYQAPNLQCGILVLISEVTNIHSNLLDNKLSNDFCDSDSEEHYEDVPDEDDDVKEIKEGAKPKLESEDVKPILIAKDDHPHSWIHRQRDKKISRYDPDARNPLHAGAEFTQLWELLHLKQSFHPSVSLFAHQICSSKQIKYSGDPLLDFTTARFLDRFVYRNPKKQPESFRTDNHWKVFGSRKLKKADSKMVPIDTEAYLQQQLDKVPVEERFIYEYLKQREPERQQKKDNDIYSIGSDEFEKLLDGMHPEDEGKDALNFAKELELHHQKKSSKRKGKSDSEEDSDLESQEGESDFEDELDFDDEEFNKEFEDVDEELKDLDEEALCEEDFVGGVFGREAAGPSKPKRKKSKMSFDNENLFASVDEFSILLEDNVGDKIDTITAHAVSNKDKSGAKQLSWEKQRDQYVKGKNWKNTKNRKFKKKKFKK